jgi:hypothetical protein
MIELTEEQQQALKDTVEPPELLHPRTNATYVLIPKEAYDRLKGLYDDSPWTDEEMEVLAVEAGELLDQYGKNP